MVRKTKETQLEFANKDWEKFLKTDLGQAMEAHIAISDRINRLSNELDESIITVASEMRKAGKTKLSPQIHGVIYDFELAKSQEKLKVKIAR